MRYSGGNEKQIGDTLGLFPCAFLDCKVDELFLMN
jgi:hypothetical protein